MNDFIQSDEFDPEEIARLEDTQHEDKRSEQQLIVAHLQRSKEAYTRLFKSGNPTPDDVDFVMRDLAWFCGGHGSLWRSDPREQERITARNEVYQRIVEYTGLDINTLAKRYIETQHR